MIKKSKYALIICDITHIMSLERKWSGECMSKNFRDTLNEQLQDPEFKGEWDVLEPERQIMRAIIEGRDERDLTQSSSQ